MKMVKSNLSSINFVKFNRLDRNHISSLQIIEHSNPSKSTKKKGNLAFTSYYKSYTPFVTDSESESISARYSLGKNAKYTAEDTVNSYLDESTEQPLNFYASYSFPISSNSPSDYK